MVVFIISSFIVIFTGCVYLTRASVLRRDTYTDTTEDITIIGAGIGGTYAAYKLRDENLNIGLYEMSDRIGGRYYTRTLAAIPDINIELGAMRFIPSAHSRLYSILQEVNLPIVDFEQKFGIPSKKRYYLRGQHIPYTELGKPGYLPYNVRESEKFHSKYLRYKLFSENTNSTDNSEPYYTIATNDGIPIYKQSRHQVMSKIASNEAYIYMRDTSGFHYNFEDATGEYIRYSKPHSDPNPDFGLPDVKTIETGFNSLPETLLSKFLQTSTSHTMHKNRKLIKIKKMDDGRIKLKFTITVADNGETYDTKDEEIVYTKKVILCMPKEPLELIDWKPFRNKMFKHTVLESVFANPASKIFLGYSYAWWEQEGVDFTAAVTDLPIRQLYEWKVSKTSGKAILLASYTDSEGPVLWKRLQGQGNIVGGSNDVTDVTNEVIRHVHLNLAEVYNISVTEIPTPIDGAMFVFNSEPFMGGWHTPATGYKLDEVRFSLVKPSCKEEVYIASGSFAPHDYKGWSEGSFLSVEEVLSVIFGTVDTNTYPCQKF